jgi:hypothetical protein
MDQDIRLHLALFQGQCVLMRHALSKDDETVDGENQDQFRLGHGFPQTDGNILEIWINS